MARCDELGCGECLVEAACGYALKGGGCSYRTEAAPSYPLFTAVFNFTAGSEDMAANGALVPALPLPCGPVCVAEDDLVLPLSTCLVCASFPRLDLVWLGSPGAASGLSPASVRDAGLQCVAADLNATQLETCAAGFTNFPAHLVDPGAAAVAAPGKCLLQASPPADAIGCAVVSFLALAAFAAYSVLRLSKSRPAMWHERWAAAAAAASAAHFAAAIAVARSDMLPRGLGRGGHTHASYGIGRLHGVAASDLVAYVGLAASALLAGATGMAIAAGRGLRAAAALSAPCMRAIVFAHAATFFALLLSAVDAAQLVQDDALVAWRWRDRGNEPPSPADAPSPAGAASRALLLMAAASATALAATLSWYLVPGFHSDDESGRGASRHLACAGVARPRILAWSFRGALAWNVLTAGVLVLAASYAAQTLLQADAGATLEGHLVLLLALALVAVVALVPEPYMSRGEDADAAAAAAARRPRTLSSSSYVALTGGAEPEPLSPRDAAGAHPARRAAAAREYREAHGALQSAATFAVAACLATAVHAAATDTFGSESWNVPGTRAGTVVMLALLLCRCLVAHWAAASGEAARVASSTASPAAAGAGGSLPPPSPGTPLLRPGAVPPQPPFWRRPGFSRRALLACAGASGAATLVSVSVLVARGELGGRRAPVSLLLLCSVAAVGNAAHSLARPLSSDLASLRFVTLLKGAKLLLKAFILFDASSFDGQPAVARVFAALFVASAAVLAAATCTSVVPLLREGQRRMRHTVPRPLLLLAAYGLGVLVTAAALSYVLTVSSGWLSYYRFGNPALRVALSGLVLVSGFCNNEAARYLDRCKARPAPESPPPLRPAGVLALEPLAWVAGAATLLAAKQSEGGAVTELLPALWLVRCAMVAGASRFT